MTDKTENRLAVVISPVTLAHNETEGLFAARFAEMGLTSFGESPEDAVARLKTLFKDFIHACREEGVLAQTLDRLGVRWYWGDEYPETAPAYENTNEMPADTGTVTHYALNVSASYQDAMDALKRVWAPEKEHREWVAA